MKKIIPILILLISCSTRPTVKEKEEYLSRFTTVLKKQGHMHWVEIDSLENDLLTSIEDTIDKKIYEEKVLYFLRGNYQSFKYKVDSVAYLIMKVVDNTPEMDFKAMDTVNPTYSENFKEHKKSLSMLKDGLNKRIVDQTNNWEKLITDSIPVKVNLSDFWINEYPKIENMGDFQIARYELYYKSDSIVCTILKYLKAEYLTKSKSTSNQNY